MVTFEALTTGSTTQQPLQDLSQNHRRRIWHPKTRTGCSTCKRRRVKCDETRPACQRCTDAHIVCQGYNTPKAWVFQLPSQDDQVKLAPAIAETDFSDSTEERSIQISSSDGEAGSTNSSLSRSDTQKLSRKCSQHDDGLAIAGPTWSPIAKSLSGPYRTRDEQYHLKYFMEVAAFHFARANMSAEFWLTHFPRLAHQFPSTRLVLVAVSAAFGDLQIYTQAGADPRKTTFGMSTIERESQAMRIVAQRSTSVEEVLADALGFWMKAMCIGDFASALKHAFYTQKILAANQASSNYDAHLLRYCNSTSQTLLRYYRTTRGSCPLHPEDAFANCESSCFVPEDHSLEVRIADSLYHLRHALPMIAYCKYLLEKRQAWYKHHAAILKLLEVLEHDLSTLVKRWEEADRLGLNPELLHRAVKLVPYTSSPFNPVIEKMIALINADDQNLSIILELELRLRITIPTFIVATARGYGPIIVDVGLMTRGSQAAKSDNNAYVPKT